MNLTERLRSGLKPPEKATGPPGTPTPEPSLWEPHTIAVVAIFCCVCLLHLSAFLYTICFQFQGQACPPDGFATPRACEENELTTFHPSPLSGTHTPAGADTKGSRSGSCWSST
ncbi:hypothetical protein Y1Q_0018154 [Alligator mississippiensis]|uniref:Uncharacterized protein n=1 Tax=Alligator mississippiensis TaxID=8496 RepID=A0A151NCN8_ALLMI|nr:hypothetical protein Y1Q_0018154 [Alligator mississippiensis]